MRVGVQTRARRSSTRYTAAPPCFTTHLAAPGRRPGGGNIVRRRAPCNDFPPTRPPRLTVLSLVGPLKKPIQPQRASSAGRSQLWHGCRQPLPMAATPATSPSPPWSVAASFQVGAHGENSGGKAAIQQRGERNNSVCFQQLNFFGPDKPTLSRLGDLRVPGRKGMCFAPESGVAA